MRLAPRMLTSDNEANGRLLTCRGMLILPSMNRLTKHEQLVLCGVFGLLLVGLAAKTWRLRHPIAEASTKPVVVETNTSLMTVEE